MHEIKIVRPLALVGVIICIMFLTSLLYPGAYLSDAFFDARGKEERTIDLIAAHLEEKRARLPQEELREVAKTIHDASRLYGVDYRLVLAVMEAESNFRQDVVSDKGAIGIMQVRTIVAREFSREVGHLLQAKRAELSPRQRPLRCLLPLLAEQVFQHRPGRPVRLQRGGYPGPPGRSRETANPRPVTPGRSLRNTSGTATASRG